MKAAVATPTPLVTAVSVLPFCSPNFMARPATGPELTASLNVPVAMKTSSTFAATNRPEIKPLRFVTVRGTVVVVEA